MGRLLYEAKANFFSELKLYLVFMVLTKLKRDFGSLLKDASNYGGFICLKKL